MPHPAPYDHIAVCIDDSEPSQLALAEGRRLFELGASRLRVVHVVQSPLVFAGGWGGWVPDPDQLTEGARIWLQEQVKDIDGADPVLLEGYPPATVTDWAKVEGVDLVIAAAHRGVVQRALLGSFAAYLAHHAPCPVLLVRPAEA